MGETGEKQRTNAAIYMRVSSPGQEENYSLPDQLKDSSNYCLEMGYQVSEEHIYNDGAQRSYTLNRPGLDAARDAIRHGEVQVLVVGKYDRLSRNQLQQAVLVYEAQEYGARIESASRSERFDQSAVGNFMRSSAAFVAERELEAIRERTQGGRRARVRAGKLLTGGAPLYGYRWADPHERRSKSRYIPDPETAPIVQRIFREAAAGLPLRTIARNLEAEGIPTPGQVHAALGSHKAASARWYASTLRRILLHPGYIGEHVGYRMGSNLRKIRDDFTGRTHEVRHWWERPLEDPDRVLLPAEACLPLVDRAVAERAHAQMALNKAEAIRNNRDPERALLRAGHVVCGYSNGNMHVAFVTPKGGLRYGYRSRRGTADNQLRACGGRAFCICVRMLDEATWFAVLHLLADPKQYVKTALARSREQFAAEDDRARSHLRAVAAHLAKLKGEADALAETIAQPSTPPKAREYLSGKLDELLGQIQTREAEYADLQRDEHGRASTRDQLEEWEALAPILHTLAEQADYTRKRWMLRALGVRVQVWRADHTPRFIVNFDFTGLATGIDAEVLCVDDQQIASLRSASGSRLLCNSFHQ
jgi:site-specific DNA recombinase